MPPQELVPRSLKARQAIYKARRIMSMLQGTMGLEGQALDKGTLRKMTKRRAEAILGR